MHCEFFFKLGCIYIVLALENALNKIAMLWNVSLILIEEPLI